MAVQKVEYLVAWDDGTWTTTVEDVLDERDPEEFAVTLYQSERFRKAVFISVYNECPDQSMEVQQ